MKDQPFIFVMELPLCLSRTNPSTHPCGIRINNLLCGPIDEDPIDMTPQQPTAYSLVFVHLHRATLPVDLAHLTH